MNLAFWIAFGLACLGGLYGWCRCRGCLDGLADRLGCNAGWRLYVEIFLWAQLTGIPTTYAALTLLRLKYSV